MGFGIFYQALKLIKCDGEYCLITRQESTEKQLVILVIRWIAVYHGLNHIPKENSSTTIVIIGKS